MGRVHEVDVMRVVFALGVVLAAVAVVGATLERVDGATSLYAIVGALGAIATVAWILFALDPSADLAYPAAGLTAVPRRRGRERSASGAASSTRARSKARLPAQRRASPLR